MPYTTKCKFVVFTFIVSATLGAIAFGRQIAWSEPLKNWLCDPAQRPPIPGVVESLLAVSGSVSGSDLLFSIGIPLVIVLIFFAASQSRLSLFFWLPLLVLHLLNRYEALQSSNQPWGFCGLHGDNLLGAILIDGMLVVIAVIGAAIGLIYSSILRKKGQVGEC